jgi:NAD(P)-dependent dehydrogenase (short-subunit alcohol dehydrogenase family)
MRGTELRFNGRVAIMTGSARGICRAHAAVLAARVIADDLGAAVGGLGSDQGPAETAVAEIRAGVASAERDQPGGPALSRAPGCWPWCGAEHVSITTRLGGTAK